MIAQVKTVIGRATRSAKRPGGLPASTGATDVAPYAWLRGWSPAVRIALGVILGMLAAILTSGIGLPDTGSTYILLYPVVFLCAYLAGRDSGISAAASGALIFFVQLVRSWSANPFRFQHLASLLLFTAIGTGTAVLLSHLKRARNEAEAATATALKSRNEAQRAHEQADLLLRELSHRVKNDVSNLVAILRLQAGRADEGAASQLLTAADRLIVLSRVHQRLSRHGHSAFVDLSEFLEQLCADLDSTLLGVRAITLTCDIVPLHVPSGQAVAVGLIVNEMLTNAVKYAFPDGRAGRIHLALRWADGGTLELSVADDGKGFDPQKSSGGLGQKLIRSLTAQLDGSFECTSGPRGTRCVVLFPSGGRSPSDDGEPDVEPVPATMVSAAVA
jgi:two-component sensor histidine kinase